MVIVKLGRLTMKNILWYYFYSTIAETWRHPHRQQFLKRMEKKYLAKCRKNIVP